MARPAFDRNKLIDNPGNGRCGLHVLERTITDLILSNKLDSDETLKQDWASFKVDNDKKITLEGLKASLRSHKEHTKGLPFTDPDKYLLAELHFGLPASFLRMHLGHLIEQLSEDDYNKIRDNRAEWDRSKQPHMKIKDLSKEEYVQQIKNSTTWLYDQEIALLAKRYRIQLIPFDKAGTANIPLDSGNQEPLFGFEKLGTPLATVKICNDNGNHWVWEGTDEAVEEDKAAQIAARANKDNNKKKSGLMDFISELFSTFTQAVTQILTPLITTFTNNVKQAFANIGQPFQQQTGSQSANFSTKLNSLVVNYQDDIDLLGKKVRGLNQADQKIFFDYMANPAAGAINLPNFDAMDMKAVEDICKADDNTKIKIASLLRP